MKTFQKSLAAIRQYEKEYAVYKEAAEKGLVADPETKVSIRRQLREFQEEGKRLEQHKEKEKEIKVNCLKSGIKIISLILSYLESLP